MGHGPRWRPWAHPVSMLLPTSCPTARFLCWAENTAVHRARKTSRIREKFTIRWRTHGLPSHFRFQNLGMTRQCCSPTERSCSDTSSTRERICSTRRTIRSPKRGLNFAMTPVMKKLGSCSRTGMSYLTIFLPARHLGPEAPKFIMRRPEPGAMPVSYPFL